MKKYFTIYLLIIFSATLYAQEARDEINFSEEELFNKQKQKAAWEFSVTYRIAADYTQQRQHSRTNSYPNLYLNGGRLGMLVDFNLPYHTSIQTGLLYELAYGNTEQHWRNTPPVGQHIQESNEVLYLNHRIMEHQIIVPIRATYTQKLWKDLALWFYAGPQFAIGLSESDRIEDHLNNDTRAWLKTTDVRLESYNRFWDSELLPFNFAISLGGGIQWANYRLYGGYDFGLNNLVRNKNQHLWEWNWFVGFSYAF